PAEHDGLGPGVAEHLGERGAPGPGPHHRGLHRLSLHTPPEAGESACASPVAPPAGAVCEPSSVRSEEGGRGGGWGPPPAGSRGPAGGASCLILASRAVMSAMMSAVAARSVEAPSRWPA